MILFYDSLAFLYIFFFFFFQAEDGIRDLTVTGVQTCALPICCPRPSPSGLSRRRQRPARAPPTPSGCAYAKQCCNASLSLSNRYVTFPRAAPATGTRGPATAAARRGKRWRSDSVRLAHSPALSGARDRKSVV